ncbi:MAG: nitroreductase family deazaflavin-dependent oxidoreductase [Gaiellaceae bacterium]
MPGTRYLRPGFFVSRVVNPLLMALRLKPTLTVRGRKTGEPRSVPVNVLTRGSSRYVLAPRGNTQWARNLRAAGEGELKTKAGIERCRAIEVPDEEKPPLIDAYLARWGREVKAQFAELPDPADHPVFRLEPK